MTCSLLITSLPKILTFATYTTLDPPVYLSAANGQRFPTVSTGIFTRELNVAASPTIALHEVLHAPAVGYT